MSSSMTDSLRSMSPPGVPSSNQPGMAAITSPSNHRPMTAASLSSSMGMGGKAAFAEVQLMEYIPDLEEFQSEDLTMTVASAPEYKIQQITSLQELDADLVNNKPFSTIDGVSLRKLCKYLTPERFLVENDEFWDWENTFTEISSEFRKTFKAAPAPASSNAANGNANTSTEAPPPPVPEPDPSKFVVKEKRFWQ